MKGILLLSLLAVMMADIAFAQQRKSDMDVPSPEALLSQLPGVPIVDRVPEKAEIDSFEDGISMVKAKIRQIVDLMHSDAQKPQNTGVNDKAGLKSVEKAVDGQYGVSLQELETVGGMSDAEQEKWAQKYAERMKDQAMKNPQAGIEKGDKAKRLFELANEQKKLGESITERMNVVALSFEQVELQDSIESRKLEEKLRPLREQLCSGICTDAEIARSNAAEKQISLLKIQYCKKMSPLKTGAISQYLITLKSLLPDYRRLTEVQNEAAGLQQIGEIVPLDLSSYSAIDDYAAALSEAYEYWSGCAY